jgi:hypothetical protein
MTTPEMSQVLVTTPGSDVMPRDDTKDWTNWSGTYRSTTYNANFVKGNMFVPLKSYTSMFHEASNGYEFRTTAYIQYTGLYQNGTKNQLPVFIKMGVNQRGATPSDGYTHQKLVTMNMKATNPLMVNQSISYTTTEFTPTRISGTYVTTNPSDKGTWELHPTNNSQLPPYVSETASCVIV